MRFHTNQPLIKSFYIKKWTYFCRISDESALIRNFLRNGRVRGLNRSGVWGLNGLYFLYFKEVIYFSVTVQITSMNGCINGPVIVTKCLIQCFNIINFYNYGKNTNSIQIFYEIKVILRRNLSMVQTTFHFCCNVRKLWNIGKTLLTKCD